MLRKWFLYLHGEADDPEKQADVYRCMTCSKLLTWNKIHAGDACCGRIRPTEPTFLEALRLLFLPWTI